MEYEQSIDVKSFATIVITSNLYSIFEHITFYSYNSKRTWIWSLFYKEEVIFYLSIFFQHGTTSS